MPDQVPDSFGRHLRDLRISVTDRCNFRCTYCMPKEIFGSGYAFLPRSEILSFEEIQRVAAIFVRLGVEKLRITGGEPLLRKDLERLIAMLRDLPGVKDIALTTNGALLVEKARALHAAGLNRLTVSLDSLNDSTFAAMNGVQFPVEKVLRGLEAAGAAGFAPIKINAVIRRGVNDQDVLALVERFRSPAYILRFIEYMDVGESNGWQLAEVLPSAQILARIQEHFPIEPLPANYPGEVARRFRHLGAEGGGEIGLISSVTEPFCGDCSRARLSADGHLYTCLFSGQGHSLRDPLRAGADDPTLESLIRSIWSARADRYSEVRAAQSSVLPKPEMSRLGG